MRAAVPAPATARTPRVRRKAGRDQDSLRADLRILSRNTGADREDRTRGLSEDSLCHGSQQELHNPCPPAGADHDQVNSVVCDETREYGPDIAGLDEQLMPDTLEVTRHEVIHKLSLRCTPRIQDVCGGLGARHVDDRELCLMATCDRDRVESAALEAAERSVATRMLSSFRPALLFRVVMWKLRGV